MGVYINPPPGNTKLRWLTANGTLVQGDVKDLPHYRPEDDKVLVCHVDNGAFEAVAVCFCEEEKQDFAMEDGRPKVWFYVRYDFLAPYCGDPDIVGRAAGDVEDISDVEF